MNEIIKFLKKRRSVTAKKMLPGKVKDNDLRDILETNRIMITTIYNIRGGFETTCVEGSLD